MSKLEDLYYARSEEVSFEQFDEEYEKVNTDFKKVYEKILNIIPEDYSKLFDELFVLVGGLESEFGRIWFKEGFKYAFSLAAECLT